MQCATLQQKARELNALQKALHAQKLAKLQKAKKLSSLLQCSFPKTSPYYWKWENKIFSIKGHVVAVIDYINDYRESCYCMSIYTIQFQTRIYHLVSN